MSLALPLKLLHAIHRWYIRRQTLRQLSMLSDHTLQDIGLAREDIEPAVDQLLRSSQPTPFPRRRRYLPSDEVPSLSNSGLYR